MLFRSNQTNIHRMENLKEFLKEASGIKNYADEFLDYTKQRQSKESDIAGFITIVDELLKETDERKNYLDEEIKNKQKQIADIRYEEISYSIYSIEEKKNKLAHEYEQLTLEKEQVVKEKEKLEKSRDILLCAKQNEAKNNAFSECKKLESRIEVSNKNEKEKEDRKSVV